ncbi:MAG: GNAT family N-acetyltransferase [Candidatus Dormibacteraeota bacterium]|nr:GNAT family N-acetyltransferase [Candidatus Dormibacteraeota bacterium]
MAFPSIVTERLLLREWRDADVAPFIAINADPVVMEFFPELYAEERTRRFVERIRERWAELGYGLWAVERRDTGLFIGYVGLWPATFPAHFTSAVEVGWRLAADQWGQGYATEAGRAALTYGFETLGLDEIVSFTSVLNVRSWRVMERLGMWRDAGGDFGHPNVPEGHRTRAHVLYRFKREDRT